MQRRVNMLSLTTLFVGLLFTDAVLAVNVDLDVVRSANAPFNAAQEWARSLDRLSSVRVRLNGNQVPQPSVKQSGNTLRVVAVIDGNNRLVVPGKSFTMRQVAALQSWLDAQAKGGANGAASESKNRFGLTRTQLERTHDSLKALVADSTQGKKVLPVVTSIARRAGLPLSLSSGMRTIAGDAVVPDEWQGFTSGTTIAALLRPLELVMIPKVGRAGQIELVIEHDATADESWPVGWKSSLKKRELIPKIYDPLPIDIADTPIADVMKAIESRIETPMFYDTALLRLLELDPAKETVTYNSSRTIYTKAISLTLSKAQMKHEIRVDEIGRPFIWIMPRRTPRKSR